MGRLDRVAALDPRNIIEQMVKSRFPQITAVRNVF